VTHVLCFRPEAQVFWLRIGQTKDQEWPSELTVDPTSNGFQIDDGHRVETGPTQRVSIKSGSYAASRSTIQVSMNTWIVGQSIGEASASARNVEELSDPLLIAYDFDRVLDLGICVPEDRHDRTNCIGIEADREAVVLGFQQQMNEMYASVGSRHASSYVVK